MNHFFHSFDHAGFLGIAFLCALALIPVCEGTNRPNVARTQRRKVKTGQSASNPALGQNAPQIYAMDLQ
jgi:hypothetical protein